MIRGDKDRSRKKDWPEFVFVCKLLVAAQMSGSRKSLLLVSRGAYLQRNEPSPINQRSNIIISKL